MATDIGRLVARLEADASRFNRELRLAGRELRQTETRAQRASRGVRRAMDRMFASAGRAAKSIFTLRNAAIAAGAATGLGVLLKRSVDTADALQKQADTLGINVEALQELQFAAERSGVAINTFDMGLQRFIRRTSEAAAGGGEAKAALEELGIQLTDASGTMRPAEELLGDVADAMMAIEDPSRRVRLGFKLFDSEGVRIINMLTRGSAGLNAYREEARSLGGVLQEGLTREASRTKDAFTNLSLVFRTQFTRSILGAQDEARELAEVLTDPRTIRKVADLADTMARLAEAIFSVGAAAASVPDQLAFLFGGRGGLGAIETADLRERADDLENLIRVLTEGPASGRDAIAAALSGLDENLRNVDRLREQLRAINEELEGRAAAGTTDAARRRQFEALGLPVPGPQAPSPPPDSAAPRISPGGGEPSGSSRNPLQDALSEFRAREEAMRDVADRRAELERQITRDALEAQGEREEIIRMEIDARRDVVREAFAGERETRERLLQDLNAIERKALEDLEETAEDRFGGMQRAGELAFSGMADAIADWALGAELSFEQVFQSFARTLIRMEIEAAASALFGAAAGGSSGGGSNATSGIVTSVLGSLVGAVIPGFQHGGVVTGSGASGGLARVGEGGVAEVIAPVDDVLDAIGNDGPEVVVNISSPVPMRSRQSRAPGGMTRIDIEADQMVSRAIEGGPQTNAVLRARGLQRRGTRRG